MLPTRGLPPRQLGSLASRQSSILRSSTSRKFSSVRRKSAFSVPSSRTTSLQSTKWRAGATSTPNAVLSSSAVRYGSWYAPWSWGRSSTPSTTQPAEPVTASTPTPEPVLVAEPVVTTATPELQPTGIDQPAAAAVNSSNTTEGVTVEDPFKNEFEGEFDSSSILDPDSPISYWGNLKDLGLDFGWGPSALFESLLELVYINSEMGWAASIIASGLILRACLFFTFQRWGSDATAKMAAMKPILQPLQDQMEEAKRQGDATREQSLKMKQATIMKSVGADVGKQLGTGVAQAVFGFGAWRTLRGISSLPAPGLDTDGWAWFTDLTVSDPYYILPLATGGIIYTVMKRGGETGVQDQTAQASMQKTVMYALPTIMTLMTSFQPAGIQLYFLVNSITGGITGQALRTPSIRRLLGIRPIPSPDSQKLYSKVVSGEVNLNQVKGVDGKIRYEAPRSQQRSTVSKSGIKVKNGVLPPHLKVAGIPEVKETEAPKSTSEQIRSMYAASSTWWRKFQDPRDPEVRKKQDAKEKQKRALAKYEEERKRAMGE